MTFNKILRWTVLISLAATLFSPIVIMSSVLFPFIVGKALFFRVFVEIAFMAWVLLMLRDASVRPKKSVLFWAFLAFGVVIGLADLTGVDAWKSFWSNFERMEGYLLVLHLWAYFVVLSSVLATENMWKRFLQVSLGASIIVSFYGFLQLTGQAVVNQGGVRLDSYLGNATYLAVYLLFNIFFALILLAREKSGSWGKITGYSVIVVFHTIILYHTGTRGALLGLLGGLMLAALLIALFDKAEKTRRIVAASFVGASLLVIFGFLGIRNTEFVQNNFILQRFASISLSDVKTQARGYIWPMAIKGFTERPLLGWGQENFNYVFNANYDPHLYGQEQWFDRAHNVFLDWLVAGGTLGFLAYLSLWASALYLLWRKATDLSFIEKALLTGLGGAYFLNNLFVFDNIASYVMFMVVLAFIQFKSTRLVKPFGADSDEADDSDTRTVAALALILLVVGLYFFNWRAYATASSLIDALRYQQGGAAQAENVYKAFEKTLSYDTIGRPEVVERVVEAAGNINSSGASIDLRQRFFVMAEKALTEQLTRHPGDARYELFAGNFYATYGLGEQALTHFSAAQKLSPRKQTMFFSLGNLFLSAKRYDDAVAAFKAAYDLDQDAADPLRFYVASLVYAGKKTEAQALLKAKTGSDDMTSDIFLQTYISMGDWSNALAILKARVRANPKSTEDLKNLAAGYLQSGDKVMAIATLRQMSALDPALKPQVDEYIRQVQTGN